MMIHEQAMAVALLSTPLRINYRKNLDKGLKRLRNYGTVSAPWINHYSIDRNSLLICPDIYPINVHFHA